MKDGGVCGKNCFRDKCHNHTNIRMEKDRAHHKAQRALRRAAPLRGDLSIQETFLPTASTLRAMCTRLLHSIPQKFLSLLRKNLSPHKRSLARCQNKKEKATSRTRLSRRTPPIRILHYARRLARWVYEVGRKISLMQTIPDGFTSKRDMISKLLDKLMRDVHDIEGGKISKNDFYVRINRHYAEISSKYGSVLQNLK